MKLPKINFFSAWFILLFTSMAFAHRLTLEDMDLAPRMLVLCIFNIAGLVFLFRVIKSSGASAFSFLKAPLFIAVTGFIVTLSIGYFNSINKADALFEIIKMTSVFSFLVITIILLAEKKIDVKTISIACLAATSITIAYTISNIFHEFRYAVVKKEVFSITYTVFGNHCNKNTLAEFLMLSLPLNMYLVFDTRKPLRISALMAVLLSVLIIVILKSASVLVALLFTAVVTGFILFLKKYKPDTKQIIFSIAGVSLVLFFIVLNNHTLKNRLSLFYHYTIDKKTDMTISNNNSTFERLLLWKNSLQMIREEPLTGVGLSNWKILFPKYGYTGAKYLSADTIKFTRAHNDYLQFWSENGLICMLFFLSIFVYGIFLLIQRLKVVSGTGYMITLVSLAGLLSYSILCFFSYTSERPFNLVFLMIYAAISIAAMNNNKSIPAAKLIAIFMGIILIPHNFYGAFLFKNRIRNEFLLHDGIYFQRTNQFGNMLRAVSRVDVENFPIDYTGTPLNWYKGTAYFLNDKVETAGDYYLKAVEEAPYHVQVLTDAGVIMEKQGKKGEAEKYYLTAIEINRNYPEAKLNLSALKFNERKITEAYNALRDFPPKSMSKKAWEKMTGFKKTFLIMLADSALLRMKDEHLKAPSKEQIFYPDLLKADSIAEHNQTPVTDELVKVFLSVK